MRHCVIFFGLVLLSACSSTETSIQCHPGDRTECECTYAGFRKYGISVCGAYAWSQCYCEPFVEEAGLDEKH